jgi:hypothetical protein
MQILGTQGLVDSSGAERVTPYFTSGTHATLEDSLTVNPVNPSLVGQLGRAQIRVRVDGMAAYSQPFFARFPTINDIDFDGVIGAEGAVRITLENPGSSRVGQILQRFDDTRRESFWDYDSKPFAEENEYDDAVVLDVPITFGTAYDLRVEMWVWALVNGYGFQGSNDNGDHAGYQLPAGMHTAIADFYKTATLDGVTVLDNAGNPVEASVMGSELNYLNPFTAPPAQELPPLTQIPEPTSALFAAMVLLTIGCRRIVIRR